MVHTKKCLICGTVYEAHRSDGKYCSISCANRARNPKASTYHKCPYQENLECTAMKCHKCGWNPEVAKARLDKILGVTHEG
jgi:hypothetical protein